MCRHKRLAIGSEAIIRVRGLDRDPLPSWRYPSPLPGWQQCGWQQCDWQQCGTLFIRCVSCFGKILELWTVVSHGSVTTDGALLKSLPPAAPSWCG